MAVIGFGPIINLSISFMCYIYIYYVIYIYIYIYDWICNYCLVCLYGSIGPMDPGPQSDSSDGMVGRSVDRQTLEQTDRCMDGQMD